MGCVQCGVVVLGGYEISYVSWRLRVGTWGKCCYVCMRIVIGRFMVSYYVCGAFMYIIYVPYIYVLDYNIQGYGNCVIVQYIHIRHVYNVHKCSTHIIG